MLERREMLALAASSLLVPGIAAAQPTRSAAALLNEPGPEGARLAEQAGTWDVIESVWPEPGASPTVTTGLLAERRMVGAMLQETLRHGTDPTPLRMDFLTFNRVEGHWQYVSMDFRAPVGIMPASSFDRGEEGRIDLLFQPLALPGVGTAVSGQMLRMRQTISSDSRNRETKDQFFAVADGTGSAFLAHRYAYSRRG